MPEVDDSEGNSFGARFGRLVRSYRDDLGMSARDLTIKVWEDEGRKSSLSRLENGKVANPDAKTVQAIAGALDIPPTEVEALRQPTAMPDSFATALDALTRASRDQMVAIAVKFEIEGLVDLSDAELRSALEKRAEDWRRLQAEVEAIDDGLKRLSNLKAAAQDAIARGDLNGVEELLERVQTVELEEAAKTAELRSKNALLRGRVDQAYRLLSATADSFGAVDELEPARRKILQYGEMLLAHGLRYGSPGIELALEMIRSAVTTGLRNRERSLWARGQYNLGNALLELGNRLGSPEYALPLWAEAMNAYYAALTVYTKDSNKLPWAQTINGLGNALLYSGLRSTGSKRKRLLRDAIEVYKCAEEVFTRTKYSEQWSGLQHNLGRAYQAQGERMRGPERNRLLGEAIAAYNASLEIRNTDDLRRDRGVTLNSLGTALVERAALRLHNEPKKAYLFDAINYFDEALKIRTEEDHPVAWAMTSYNLAVAQQDLGALIGDDERTQILVSALANAEAALGFYDGAGMPHDLKKATFLRDAIARELAEG